MLHLFKLHFLAVGLYIITIAIGLVYAGSYHFVLGGNGSSTYNFGYDTNHESSDADGNKQDHGPRLMREETRLADGTVVGRYGYTDPFGVFRQVEYVAGPNGYYAYEDVGGGGGSTTLPLFFKATARQREQLAAQGARKMPGLAVLSDKFNPPLYHPEAHLADDPPVASVSVSTSSSSLDRSVDYNRLGGKPQRLSSNRNNNNNPSDRIVSVPTSPSSSSTSSNSRFQSGSSSFNTVNASHDQRPKDGNRLPEYRNGPSNERISNPSTSPKTAFQFDYDQHALRRRAGTLSSSNPNNGNNKDDVNTDEPMYLLEGGNDTEDLKELESYRVPTNVNVHRTSDYSKLYPSGHDDDVSESEYERSSAYSSSRTSSSVGRSLVPEAPVYRPVFSDESEEEIRPIFNRQDVPEPSNSDSPKKVRLSSSSSTYSPSSSRRSIDSNGGGHSVGDNSRSSGSNVDPSSDSGIRILGSSLSSSTRIVINDTLDEIQAARLREATIPEVEILSTYGKRLSPRIDDYAESFIQYGPRVPPTFISDDIKDSNFDQIEREDDPIKLEKSIEEHSNVPENNATNVVPKPEVVTRKHLDLEDEFKIRTPSTGASPRRDSPIENAKESRISDRAPAATTTTESSLRTQRFKEATTTIAPADLSLDVTTVTSTASARIVKHPLDRASSSPTVDIVRDEVIDSRGELVTSEPLYQIETTTKLADIFPSSKRKASKPNGFGLDVELPTTTYAPSFDLDRSEESYDVTTATSPTKPINSPREDEFLRIINERFFGRQSPEGPKTTVPNTPPPPPSSPPTTTIQTPVVTSKSSVELPSGLISEQTTPKQQQNEAPKNFSGGLIAKTPSSKETFPTNDALDHYQHDSIEQEDWLHDIMKKKSLNNSLHRIETDVETPLDPNKPKKRIIKLFYKKGKLLQGQPGDHISGDIKASASGPTKVFRMRTVKLSKGFSGPILNPVQLTQEDRQHSKRHYENEPVTPKSHEKFVENINRTQPAEIVTTTTTTQSSTTIKIATLPPASPTPPSLPVPSSRAPPPSSSFQNQPPKARRPVLRGSIGNANRSTTIIKKRKIVLAPKPNDSLNKSEQNLTKIENLELSRKNEASLISSISRSPLYVPPIMGLMDTRVGDEERKNQPLVGKLTSELVSSDVKISRSGLLHGSDSRISSLYVPPIPAGIVRGHRSAESSGSALSNIFSIIAGSSSPLAASTGSGSSSGSGHGRTSNSYLNPVYFWKR